MIKKRQQIIIGILLLLIDECFTVDNWRIKSELIFQYSQTYYTEDYTANRNQFFSVCRNTSYLLAGSRLFKYDETSSQYQLFQSFYIYHNYSYWNSYEPYHGSKIKYDAEQLIILESNYMTLYRFNGSSYNYVNYLNGLQYGYKFTKFAVSDDLSVVAVTNQAQDHIFILERFADSFTHSSIPFQGGSIFSIKTTDDGKFVAVLMSPNLIIYHMNNHQWVAMQQIYVSQHSITTAFSIYRVSQDYFIFISGQSIQQIFTFDNNITQFLLVQINEKPSDINNKYLGSIGNYYFSAQDTIYQSNKPYQLLAIYGLSANNSLFHFANIILKEPDGDIFQMAVFQNMSLVCKMSSYNKQFEFYQINRIQETGSISSMAIEIMGYASVGFFITLLFFLICVSTIMTRKKNQIHDDGQGFEKISEFSSKEQIHDIVRNTIRRPVDRDRIYPDF